MRKQSNALGMLLGQSTTRCPYILSLGKSTAPLNLKDKLPSSCDAPPAPSTDHKLNITLSVKGKDQSIITEQVLKGEFGVERQ